MSKIKLDWLGKEQRVFLERGYLENSPSPEHRYEAISNNIEKICENNFWNSGINPSVFLDRFKYTTEGISNRFNTYISKNWVSFASPVLSNFGGDYGLPISCNHGKIPDTLNGIFSGMKEMALLAKYGAGTAKNFSKIRAKGESITTGGKSEGVMEWISLYAHAIVKVTQGSVRRGFLTTYLSVEHPEILEFLKIGTKEYNDSKPEFFKEITTAVTIPKDWMEDLLDGSKKHREIWRTIMKIRNEIGFPYILWEDNCNINHAQVYADKKMWIDNANICIEAMEYCDDDKEFACCLSSTNLEYYDDWKNDPYFLIDMYIMLDCVITEYIEKGKGLPGMEKALKFAEEHRAIGLGVLGFHTYLQKKNIVIGELPSFQANYNIFSLMREKAEIATKYMAEAWGEPEMLKGYGQRNTSKIAIAPTKSSSFIMGGISQGIEPIKSNYHEKDLAKIQSTYKNPELERLLKSKDLDNSKIWKSILVRNGSVQHLVDELSEHERNVFKTFPEISQMDLIKLAAQRQQFIDMGQSLNIMIHPDTPVSQINELYLTAWSEGVKSLYYQNNINAAQTFNENLMTCTSCEG